MSTALLTPRDVGSRSRRSDLELERRFVSGLSPRTRYLRLLSGRQLLPGGLERWTDIDPTREIALIAVVAQSDRDGEQEIAVARCAFDDGDPLFQLPPRPPRGDEGSAQQGERRRVGLTGV